MCEEYKCVHCGKKAKFMDSERDAYCSEECYLLAWKVNFQKLKKRMIFDCSYCDATIDHCDECHEDISDRVEMICELEQGKHFCCTDCLFKHYDWQTIEDKKADIISQIEGKGDD